MKEVEVGGLQHKAFPVCMAALWCFLLADNIQSVVLCLMQQHKQQKQPNNSLYIATSHAHSILIHREVDMPEATVKQLDP